MMINRRGLLFTAAAAIAAGWRTLTLHAQKKFEVTHTDAEWRFLTEHYVRRQPDGTYRAHYDPKIAEPFNAEAPHKDFELWPVWERVRCPTLVIRGGLSDLLTRETVERMRTSGPHAESVELRGIGHAPTLLHDDQIAIVQEFLVRG